MVWTPPENERLGLLRGEPRPPPQLTRGGPSCMWSTHGLSEGRPLFTKVLWVKNLHNMLFPTMRHDFMSTRMAIIKKTGKSQ